MTKTALAESGLLRTRESGPKRETLLEAGYKYVRPLGNRCHLLHDLVTDNLEVWTSNKDVASYAIVMGNTALEFCRSWEGQR